MLKINTMKLFKILNKNFKTLASSKLILKEMEQIVSFAKFKKGVTILKETSYVQVIPLVVSGVIKVFKEEENGNEVLLYYIKPGESCIMSIMAAEKNVPVNIRAEIEEDAELLLIPKDKLWNLRKNFPNWNLFVYELFNNKFEEVIDMVKILTFSNKEKRLLEYLHKKAVLNNSDTIYKSHQEIANELGSSREVISRLLKKLENDKKVQLQQRKIKIL